MMTSLCKWLIASGLCISLLPVTFAEDTVALAKRLHNAADASSLDDPVLQPWYLKLIVQIHYAKHKSSEQGTIEEWWSPGEDKRVYKTPSYSATEIRNSKGLYRETSQPNAPYLLNAVREGVVHPMATSEEIDEAIPHLRADTTLSNNALDCIMLERPIKNFNDPPAGYFPTYCLAQNRDLLRFFFSLGSGSATYNKMGSFQGRTVALESVVVSQGRASVQVVTLESREFDTSVFAVGENFERQDGLPVTVSPAEMAKQKLTTVPPLYPPFDKQKGISGTVHLLALIGTDGHIHRLKIIDTPAGGLAISAVNAVQQWTYTPYLVKGMPVEVSTTIAITYNIAAGGIVRMEPDEIGDIQNEVAWICST